MIKVPHPDKEGEEIEVYTPDEVAARDAEKDAAITAKDTELAAARAEVEKHKRVASEQTTNFKRFSELGESEKAALSAEKIAEMKRAEAAEDKVKALEDSINSDRQARIKSDTDAALKKYHGGDEKLKEALEKNFKMINLEGTDTETIQERARLAMSMEAGKNGGRNPIFGNMNGGAPQSKEASKTEEFLKSEKGAAALKLMGEGK